MSELAKLQRSMKRAILGDKEAAALAGTDIIGGDLNPDQRLQIHYNNYRETLVDSLKSTFPVSLAFVGEAFFEGAAKRFVVEMPPRWAQLSEYGGELGSFFEDYEHAETIPYVADLLRLEWAVHAVQNGFEDPIVSEEEIEELLEKEGGVLKPVSQMQIIISDYPVLSLWMVGTGQIPPEAVHLEQGGQIALVIGINGAVQLQALEEKHLNILEKLSIDNGAKINIDAELMEDLKHIASRGMLTRVD